MDPTKFFEPLRGTVTYLMGSMGTFIITIVLVLVNFETDTILKNVLNYLEPYRFLSEFLLLNSDLGKEMRILATVFSIFILVSVLEIHRALLMFLNRYSLVKFNFAGDMDGLRNIRLIWRCYCDRLSLNELVELHRMRLRVEGKVIYPAELFDSVCGWMFMMIILSFILPVKSAFILFITIAGLFLLGWLKMYNVSQDYSSMSGVMDRAAWWLYENRLHSPRELTADQLQDVANYRNEVSEKTPRIGFYFPWLDFIWRLAVPQNTQREVQNILASTSQKIRSAISEIRKARFDGVNRD